MSTLQDFENAPVGATAKKEVGLVAIREGDETDYHPWMCTTYGHWFSNEDLVERGYTLNPTAPTTAQEAFDLAWDLGHTVKEGQVIPEGAKWMKKVAGNVREYTMSRDYTVTANDTYILRTHEPLPDPEPDWLDAPAVLAAMDDCSWQKVWLPRSGGNWVCTCCGVERHWSKMSDVTPLYPEKDNGGMHITESGEIQFKDRNGQIVWEI